MPSWSFLHSAQIWTLCSLSRPFPFELLRYIISCVLLIAGKLVIKVGSLLQVDASCKFCRTGARIFRVLHYSAENPCLCSLFARTHDKDQLWGSISSLLSQLKVDDSPRQTEETKQGGAWSPSLFYLLCFGLWVYNCIVASLRVYVVSHSQAIASKVYLENPGWAIN